MYQKIFSLCLVLCMVMGTVSSAYAAESNNMQVAEKNLLTDEQGTPRGTGWPSSSWDLSRKDYSGVVDFKLKVITDYYFTGNTKYYVDVDFTRDKVVLYDNVSVSLVCNGSVVETKSFSCSTSGTSKSFTFLNCDPKKKYAIEFSKANDSTRVVGDFTISN